MKPSNKLRGGLGEGLGGGGVGGVVIFFLLATVSLQVLCEKIII